LVRAGVRNVTIPFCTCTLRNRSVKAEPDGFEGTGVGRLSEVNTQFGWPPTCSNKMFGPTSVSLLTSIRRQSKAGSETCASIRSAQAISGRVPPGKLASRTPLTSMIGQSDRLIRTGPSKVRARPVASCTAAAICDL